MPTKTDPARVTPLASALLLVALVSITPAAAQNPGPANPAAAAAANEALFRDRCASCHDVGISRAPTTAALFEMSADAVRAALTSGVMREQAASLTPVQIDGLARAIGRGGAARPASENRCATTPPFTPSATAGAWNGWGVTPAQQRFQPAAAAGLGAADVPRLKLKWAFGFPGVPTAYGQPSVVGGRVFVGSANGTVYALDAQTGCTHWSFRADARVRTAITVSTDSRPLAFFGDMRATAYAVDAATGALVWKVKLEAHPAANITGAPTLAAGKLFVPMSSSEEGVAVTPSYECCTFRGSVTALNPQSGAVLWKSHTIAEAPKPSRRSKVGTQNWGPSGAAVWSSPTYDPVRNAVYVTTGDGYSDPVGAQVDAFVAFDAETGRMLWFHQTTPGDAFIVSCDFPAALNANCPDAKGPDHDFGSSPMLLSLPNGRRALVSGQKSGVVHALDPDRDGARLWDARIGTGGRLGGVQWGLASDGVRIYAARSDVGFLPAQRDTPGAQPFVIGAILLNPKQGGGLFALDPVTGEQRWMTPHPGCVAPGCSPSQSAAVTAIPGVVFSGGLDGRLRAYAADDGRIIWDVDTKRDYDTVNGVKAKGGSLDGPGAVVAGGLVLLNSGYDGFGGAPGNVLLAFSVDGK